MVRVLESVGAELVVRTAGGDEVLNTAKPMPCVPSAAAWSANFTDVALNFPDPGNSAVLVGGEIQITWAVQDQALTQVVLGAIGTATPDFFFGRFRAKRSGGVDISAADKKTAFLLCPTQNTWSRWHPFSGSVLMEFMFNDNDPPMGFRHFNVAVSGGNWVLQGWTSNGAITAPLSTFMLAPIGYTFDIDLTWGLFK